MSGPKGSTRKQMHPSRDAALKSLKAFCKVRSTEDAEELGVTVMNETDRGAVILLTTAVEDMLVRRIKSSMVDLNADENARIFGPDAILGTFSAKIKLSQAMGYIDRETARMCDLVREMRNACAHSGRDISFANNELSDVMSAAYRYISDEEMDPSDYKGIPILGKLHFLWLISYLIRVIRTGSKDSGVELVNRLIADANSSARAEIKKQKKSRARSSKTSGPDYKG